MASHANRQARRRTARHGRERSGRQGTDGHGAGRSGRDGHHPNARAPVDRPGAAGRPPEPGESTGPLPSAGLLRKPGMDTSSRGGELGQRPASLGGDGDRRDDALQAVRRRLDGGRDEHRHRPRPGGTCQDLPAYRRQYRHGCCALRRSSPSGGHGRADRGRDIREDRQGCDRRR